MKFHYILTILNIYFNKYYLYSVPINMFKNLTAVSCKKSGVAEVWRIQEFMVAVSNMQMKSWLMT